MIKYTHKHTYVYKFPLSRQGNTAECEYTLCTDIDDANCKANRILLESMLRLVYGHLPKSVKFSHTT